MTQQQLTEWLSFARARHLMQQPVTKALRAWIANRAATLINPYT